MTEPSQIKLEIPLSFQALLECTDPFQLVIKGHLWIESELINILTEYFAHPDEIKIDRVGFEQKLDIAIALGLVRRHDKGAFRKLNSLRNRLAHNVEAEINRKDELDLFNSFGKIAKFSSGVKSTDDFEFPELLQTCIAVLYLSVHRVREIIISAKQESFRLKMEVDRVLRRKMDGAMYYDDLYFPNFLDHPSVMRKVAEHYSKNG